MSKKHKRRIPSFLKSPSKGGAAPGTLTHVGKQKMDKPCITVMEYDPEVIREKSDCSIEESFAFLEGEEICWIDVCGVHEAELIKAIGERYSLHPLLMEDVLNTAHRPKVEEYDDCLFVVVKMLHYDEKAHAVSVEQVSFVLKDNVLLSFQERQLDDFDPIRDRLRKKKGKLRLSEADYLLYRLLDALSDGHLSVLESLGEDVELLEQSFMESAEDTLIESLHQLRRELLYVRKAVYPLRDVISHLQRTESPLITETTLPYLRDVADHSAQSIDMVDTYRDLLSNMLDNYLSLMSHRMNSVMKVLTVIATIFIPITFIAGVYGMNFRHMPELTWQYGYPFAWGMIAFTVLVMVGYFKKKGWW